MSWKLCHSSGCSRGGPLLGLSFRQKGRAVLDRLSHSLDLLDGYKRLGFDEMVDDAGGSREHYEPLSNGLT